MSRVFKSETAAPCTGISKPRTLRTTSLPTTGRLGTSTRGAVRIDTTAAVPRVFTNGDRTLQRPAMLLRVSWAEAKITK